MFEIELTALRLKLRPGWFAPRMSVPQHYLILRCALGLKSLFSRYTAILNENSRNQITSNRGGTTAPLNTTV